MNDKFLLRGLGLYDMPDILSCLQTGVLPRLQISLICAVQLRYTSRCNRAHQFLLTFAVFTDDNGTYYAHVSNKMGEVRSKGLLQVRKKVVLLSCINKLSTQR